MVDHDPETKGLPFPIPDKFDEVKSLYTMVEQFAIRRQDALRLDPAYENVAEVFIPFYVPGSIVDIDIVDKKALNLNFLNASS